jgi:hypothetical protein
MLPILPALILLLLHGPSNFERLATEGRLPAGLEAFHREIEPAVANRDRAMLALLATRDPQLSSALYALLRSEEPALQPVKRIKARAPRVEIYAGEAPAPRDGFEECRRTRDGPLRIA